MTTAITMRDGSNVGGFELLNNFLTLASLYFHTFQIIFNKLSKINIFYFGFWCVINLKHLKRIY